MSTIVTVSPQELAARAGQFPPTPDQSAVIGAELVPSAIIAGAGSGKTETMANRVVWLVANKLVRPSQVLGLTFTRKAARELSQRIRDRLGVVLRSPEGPVDPEWESILGEEVSVSTYDAYARKLVTEHGLRIGIEPTTALAGDASRWLIAREVVLGYDGPLEAVNRTVSSIIDDVLSLASEMAGHLTGPEDVQRLAADLTERVTALPDNPSARKRGMYSPTADMLEAQRKRSLLMPLVQLFEQRKREQELMDFGDVMRAACALAEGFSEVGEVERDLFKVVLLDEYQDTSMAQARLLKAVFAGHPVTAVGDPCQAIYGFRGASENTLRIFRSDFAAEGRLDRHKLTTSFRNDRRILQVANGISAPLRLDGLDVAVLQAKDGADEGEVTASMYGDVEVEAASIADLIHTRWNLDGTARPSIAVICRRRSDFERIAQQLRTREIPFEITGLAGLLAEPEIVDVVAMLQVLVDPGAGAALLRLMAGSRWRIGPRDLQALANWSARLAPTRSESSPGAESDEVDTRSLVESLDAISEAPAGTFSPEGLRRLRALSADLRRLRSAIDQPLSDVVALIERELHLDVEVTVRDFLRGHTPRAQLDQFIDVANEFSNRSGTDSLPAFLAYLRAAQDTERGLTMADTEVAVSDRVQLLTAHAAKGLEWDIVIVPGLVSDVFPSKERTTTGWLKSVAMLPFPLRGDAGQLPVFDLRSARFQVDVRDAIAKFQEDYGQHSLGEERRLFYVAATRARHELHLSGYRWNYGKRSKEASIFLVEAREILIQSPGWQPTCWADLDEGEINPLDSKLDQQAWPVDPLGPARAEIEIGAQLVHQVMQVAKSPPVDEASDDPLLAARLEIWRRDTDLLVTERIRRSRRGPVEVRVPDRLSASQLVRLRQDPQLLAMDLRRPVPRGPGRAARRGTEFHAWLEQRFEPRTLLDIEDLPGSGDADRAGLDTIDELKAAFEQSSWARRSPIEVEVPFDLMIGTLPVRGRMDAVFAWESDDTAQYDVIDWKTGVKPTGADLVAAEIQLAIYRLAWARIAGVSPDRVRAGFHYVLSGHTHRPSDLLDAAGLEALITAVPGLDRDSR